MAEWFKSLVRRFLGGGTKSYSAAVSPASNATDSFQSSVDPQSPIGALHVQYDSEVIHGHLARGDNPSQTPSLFSAATRAAGHPTWLLDRGGERIRQVIRNVGARTPTLKSGSGMVYRGIHIGTVYITNYRVRFVSVYRGPESSSKSKEERELKAVGRDIADLAKAAAASRGVPSAMADDDGLAEKAPRQRKSKGRHVTFVVYQVPLGCIESVGDVYVDPVQLSRIAPAASPVLDAQKTKKRRRRKRRGPLVVGSGDSEEVVEGCLQITCKDLQIVTLVFFKDKSTIEFSHTHAEFGRSPTWPPSPGVGGVGGVSVDVRQSDPIAYKNGPLPTGAAVAHGFASSAAINTPESKSKKGKGRGGADEALLDVEEENSDSHSNVLESIDDEPEYSSIAGDLTPTVAASQVNVFKFVMDRLKSYLLDQTDPKLFAFAFRKALDRNSSRRLRGKDSRTAMNPLTADVFRSLSLSAPPAKFESALLPALAAAAADAADATPAAAEPSPSRSVSRRARTPPAGRMRMDEGESPSYWDFTASEIEAGWEVFDMHSEFKRMGVSITKEKLSKPQRNSWRFYNNSAFQTCPTYPRKFLVPAHLSDDTIAKSAAFRSRGRLPALTWKNPRSYACILRSAQPLTGISRSTSRADEQLVNDVRIITSAPRMRIVDLRSKTNAVGNTLIGKGWEVLSGYDNTTLHFFGIENIHSMRSSYEGLRKAIHSTGHPRCLSFLSSLEGSAWLSHISLLLNSALRVAHTIEKEHCSVLLHCSDGWDRTAQIASLAQILMDPFYRTIRGLMVLIEKDWVSFGFLFRQRFAVVKKTDGYSPIFVQFMDALWHIWSQFPEQFEYNERLLMTILHYSMSALFGNFIFNSERKRRHSHCKQRTVSLWTLVMHNLTDFLNDFYDPAAKRPVLIPRDDLRTLSANYWKTFYLRHVAMNVDREKKLLRGRIAKLRQVTAEMTRRLHVEAARAEKATRRAEKYKKRYLRELEKREAQGGFFASKKKFKLKENHFSEVPE